MRRRLSVLASLAVLAACDTGGPYVYMDPTVRLTKTIDVIRTTGTFSICFEDGEEKQVAELAAETCGGYHLVPLKYTVQRDQCSMTKPHRATYYCIDPRMRMANGTYINPLNNVAVTAWLNQQARVKAYAASHGGEKTAPAATPAAAPAAAPAPAPAPTAVSAPEFDPQVGGWGEAWKASGEP